jgi:two-component system, NtrC family, sensor kinase
MQIFTRLNLTIRKKLLLFIVGLVSMVIISITVATILQWKAMIITKHLENVRALTNTFAISILDGFIYSETSNIQKENLFENYISNFLRNVDDVKYISIVDNESKVIAHSDPSKYNKFLGDSLSMSLLHLNKFDYSIYTHETFGLILETATPLQISKRKWGLLRIAFDANPVQSEVKNVIIIMTSIAFLVIALTIFILFIIINSLMRSLRELVEMMDKTDLDLVEKTIIPPRNDEVGLIVKHFEKLKSRLAQSKVQLINAQKQIYQAEKLASIGRLASGVAHEINNPLNGIKSCMYAIKNEPENSKLSKQYLDLIDEGLIYIETVVKKLLGFSRPQSKTMNLINLNDVIQKVISLLDFKLDQKEVQIEYNMTDNLPEIKADTQLIQEVCMNLVLNSFDAIQKNGKIEISTGYMENDKVFFAVKDNGDGINEEDILHIFEPFYTTKDPGEGTGLGLSVSQSIIESHGGKIEVKSSPGNGTTFLVILPIESNI